MCMERVDSIGEDPAASLDGWVVFTRNSYNWELEPLYARTGLVPIGEEEEACDLHLKFGGTRMKHIHHYTPGFHIFLTREDAEMYKFGQCSEDQENIVRRVHCRHVLAQGMTTLASHGQAWLELGTCSGPVVVVKYRTVLPEPEHDYP